MKFLILSLILSASLPAFAVEDIEGCYQYSDFDIMQIQHRIPVYTKSKKGKKKLQALKTDEYTCASKPNSWYLCKKFLDKSFAAKKKVAEKLKSLPTEICFGELRSEPTIKSQGTSLTVWDYQQDSITSNWNSNSFELLELSSLKKVWIKDFKNNRHEYILEKNSGKYQFSEVSQIQLHQQEGFYDVLVGENYK